MKYKLYKKSVEYEFYIRNPKSYQQNINLYLSSKQIFNKMKENFNDINDYSLMKFISINKKLIQTKNILSREFTSNNIINVQDIIKLNINNEEIKYNVLNKEYNVDNDCCEIYILAKEEEANNIDEIAEFKVKEENINELIRNYNNNLQTLYKLENKSAESPYISIHPFLKQDSSITYSIMPNKTCEQCANFIDKNSLI